MLAHLSADMSAALAVGDLEAAAMANAMIGKLLAARLPSHAGNVLDLAEERRRRGGG